MTCSKFHQVFLFPIAERHEMSKYESINNGPKPLIPCPMTGSKFHQVILFPIAERHEMSKYESINNGLKPLIVLFAFVCKISL